MSDTKLYFYIGQRETSKGRVVHAFVEDPAATGDFTYWPKAKARAFEGAVIGRQYDLSNGLPDLWSQSATGEKVGEKTALAWQARTQTVKAYRQQKAVKPSPELETAIKTIRAAMLAHGRQQRMAFIAWLIHQLT